MNSTISEAVKNDLVPDRRKHLRFSCMADVDIVPIHGRRQLAARLSTLSKHGCYVDSPDSFDVGTKVRLILFDHGRKCELAGTVIYVHKGWGLGIQFNETDAKQEAALHKWLLGLYLKEKRSTTKPKLDELKRTPIVFTSATP
jgi:hypothetical protein